MTITASLYAISGSGLVRDENQDFVIAGSLDDGEPLVAEEEGGLPDGPVELEIADGQRGALIVVCDGMGGGEHGNIASTAAGEAVWKEMRDEAATTDRLVLARQLRRAVRAANLAVRAQARRLKTKAMGTTIATAAMCGDVAVLAVVGDCRAYVCRGDKITPVTRDQSVVSALVSAGTLTREEARASDRRHMVLQALGPEADVVVSLSVAEMRRGDRLLLSSDGVHDTLDDHLIAHALGEHPTDEVAALERLAELVAAAGAPDNFSAVILRVDGDGLREPMAADQLPVFAELDPSEEAVVNTSTVARRLARRAGIASDIDAPAIPVTGAHAIVTADFDEPITGRMSALADTRGSGGPAQRALEDRARLHWGWWLVAGVVLAAATYWILSS